MVFFKNGLGLSLLLRCGSFCVGGSAAFLSESLKLISYHMLGRILSVFSAHYYHCCFAPLAVGSCPLPSTDLWTIFHGHDFFLAGLGFWFQGVFLSSRGFVCLRCCHHFSLFTVCLFGMCMWLQVFQLDFSPNRVELIHTTGLLQTHSKCIIGPVRIRRKRLERTLTLFSTPGAYCTQLDLGFCGFLLSTSYFEGLIEMVFAKNGLGFLPLLRGGLFLRARLCFLLAVFLF